MRKINQQRTAICAMKQFLGSEPAPEPKTPVLSAKASEAATQKSQAGTVSTISADHDLPNLYDSNRNTALKKLAQEFLTEHTLEQVKKLETEHAKELGSLEKLKDFIIQLEYEMWQKVGSSTFPKFARERIMMVGNKTNQGLKTALLDGSLTIRAFVDSKIEDLESEEAKARIEELGDDSEETHRSGRDSEV